MQSPTNSQKEHPDLYKRSIKGGAWVFAIKIATQLLGFLRFTIVFNILLKNNLELILVTDLLMGALTIFSESGFQAALVQKNKDIESYLDTAWVISILRGIILFAAIYFIAPLFASIKLDPDKAALAVSVVRVMGVCFLIRAFHNIGTVNFQKELHFHKTFWLTMTGSVAEVVFSIVLLLIYRSVWAVVVARLLSSVINLAMSYLICPYRPKFLFIPDKARELWKFGKWLFGGNIIVYLQREADDWFVFFFFLPDPLPFNLYRSAYRFATMPATHITSTISQVSFPAYSKIQDNLPRLRDAYLKVLQITALISVPTAFLIFTLGPEFVRLFLVPESHAMIPIIKILAFCGLLKSMGATRGALFQAMGKPHANFHFHCIRFAILAISIFPLTRYFGIKGTALSTFFAVILIDPFASLLVCKLLKLSVVKLFQQIMFPLIASIVMMIILLLFKQWLGESVNVVVFLGFTSLAFVIYFLVMWAFDYYFKYGYRRIIFDQGKLLKNFTKD